MILKLIWMTFLQAQKRKVVKKKIYPNNKLICKKVKNKLLD